MKIYLVTKNKHKVEEIKTVMKKFNVDVEQIPEEKYEDKSMTLTEVAEYNAKMFYKKYKKPVMVDDTGVFFKAYSNFPGSQPKRIYNELGYPGLLKKLEGKNKEAYFETVVGYYDGSVLKTFSGILECTADDKVHDLDVDVLPYERILFVNGKPLSKFSRSEKNKISHRAIAFKKLGEWLNKRSNHTV